MENENLKFCWVNEWYLNLIRNVEIVMDGILKFNLLNNIRVK